MWPQKLCITFSLRHDEQHQLTFGGHSETSARYFSEDLDSSSAIFERFQGLFFDLHHSSSNLIFAILIDTSCCNLFQVLVVEKLLRMAPVLLLKAKYKSDTRLLRDVARSYMYCISNIKMFAPLAKLFDANSTRNESRSDEVNMSEGWQRSVENIALTKSVVIVLSPAFHHCCRIRLDQ